MTHMTPRFRNVVYVVTDPGVPAFGRKGASVHVQSILAELNRRATAQAGRVVLVATRLGGAPPPALDGIEVHELTRPSTRDTAEHEAAMVRVDLQAAALVERILAEMTGSEDPDPQPPLVYQRYGLWSAEVMERARLARADTVLEVNAPLVLEQVRHRGLVNRRLAERLTVRAIAAAEAPYAVSSEVARWVESTCGRRVPVVPNGVDTSRFHTPPGSGRSAPVIGFVGTFRPWHGPELLVDAAARLGEQGRKVRLLLIGDGPCLPEVLARAERAGVDTESTGGVPPESIPALLARCDIGCAPYPAGSDYFSPLKVMEYLAAGLPTIAAGIGDLPALFTGAELTMVRPGDTVELAGAIEQLLDDPERRARLARAGRQAVLDRFTWEAVLDRVLEPTATGRSGTARRAG